MEIYIRLLFISDKMHTSPVEVVSPNFCSVNKSVSRRVVGLDIDAALREPELVSLVYDSILSLEEIPGEEGGHASVVGANRVALVSRFVILFGDEDGVAAQTERVVGVLAPG